MSSSSASDARHELSAGPTPAVPVVAPAQGSATSRKPLIDVEVAPLIAQARAAFERDLPELLREHEGQWVAYFGEKQLAFGTTRRELYQQLIPEGYPDNQLFLCFVEEDPFGEAEILYWS
jgi:hypothetical protein